MAKQQKLSAQKRNTVGRSAVNKIKSQGLVPAVIYGGKEEPLTLSINAREIGTLLSHATSEHILVDLEIADGDKTLNRLALIQEVQHHPLKRNVLHVDFHAVRADEKLHAEIPVEPTGEADGVKNFGGILEINLHSVEVECFPKDLPERIVIDVSKLGVNEAIHIKDLQLPEGVSAKADPELTVVRIAPPNVEIAPAAGEGGAGPEVIKEKKDAKAGAKPAAGAAKAPAAAAAKPAGKK